MKELRKLYLAYKQRDSLLIDTKKSILYSMVMKTIMVIYTESSDEKVMRVADATSSEILKEISAAEEGGLEKFRRTVFAKAETYARVRNV